VLWGAYVRATGSGAGCGNHWPLCNGEVVPRSPQSATLIELAHRLSSGLALLAVAALFWWALRKFPRRHPARRAAVLSLVFILSEALIGAGLVLFEQVAHNASLTRAFSLSAHLVNTFTLLATLALTSWWASGRPPITFKRQGSLAAVLALGVFGTMVLGVSGAIAALGDTLFPSASLAEAWRQDFSPAAHLFIRLRVLHPVLAVAIGAYLVFLATFAALERPEPLVRKWAWRLAGLVIVQSAAGALNVLLQAPNWMQLVHLLLADLVWIALVLLSAGALSSREVAAETAQAA